MCICPETKWNAEGNNAFHATLCLLENGTAAVTATFEVLCAAAQQHIDRGGRSPLFELSIYGTPFQLLKRIVCGDTVDMSGRETLGQLVLQLDTLLHPVERELKAFLGSVRLALLQPQQAERRRILNFNGEGDRTAVESGAVFFLLSFVISSSASAAFGRL